jgi:hypothetical protein
MMKTVIFTSMVVLLLGACVLPAIPTPNTGATPNTGPTADVDATVNAILSTSFAQTLTAQPTLPTDTPTLVIDVSPTPGISESPTATFTTTPDLTTTPATATSTATLAAANPATSIPTLTIRLYGTLPPAVPSSDIRLINKSKTEAYISLQVTSPDGRYAVLEYPVTGTIDIKAPLGSYLYVAWVGGRKMVGNFKLHGNESLSITLYRDKVVIN